MKKSFEAYVEDIPPPTPEAYIRQPTGGRLGKEAAILPSSKDEYLDKGELQLSDALFAYQSIVDICKQQVQDSKLEGAKYFQLFMDYLIGLHNDLDRKDQNMNGLPLDMIARYIELKNFIKHEIFYHFLQMFVTHMGAKSLIELIKDKIKTLKLKEFGEVLVSLVNEKRSIKAMEGRAKKGNA